mgnify:FL=1
MRTIHTQSLSGPCVVVVPTLCGHPYVGNTNNRRPGPVTDAKSTWTHPVPWPLIPRLKLTFIQALTSPYIRVVANHRCMPICGPTNPLWSAAIIICGLALPGDTCVFKACEGHPVTTFGLKVPWSPRAYIGTHFGAALCPQVF